MAIKLENISYLLAFFDRLFDTFGVDLKTANFYKEHLQVLVGTKRVTQDEADIITDLINFANVMVKGAWEQEVDNKDYFVRVVEKCLRKMRNNSDLHAVETELNYIVADPAFKKYEKVLQLVAKVFGVSITTDEVVEKNTHFGTYHYQNNMEQQEAETQAEERSESIKPIDFSNSSTVSEAIELYQKIRAVVGDVTKYVIYVARSENMCGESEEPYTTYNVAALGVDRANVRGDMLNKLINAYKCGALLYVCKCTKDLNFKNIGLQMLQIHKDATDILCNYLRACIAEN